MAFLSRLTRLIAPQRRLRVEAGEPYRAIPLTPERRQALLVRLARGEIVCNEKSLAEGGEAGSLPNDLRDGVLRVEAAVGGRAVMMWEHSWASVPEEITAGDAWRAGWWQNGWPKSYDGTDYPPDRLYLRGCSGPPDPARLVDCECACECGWYGRLDEADHIGGVLRCAECVAAGHPPELRVGI